MVGFKSQLVGEGNLSKMVKNCMKITKSTFLGQNIGERDMGGKSQFFKKGKYPSVSPPPTRGNPVWIDESFNQSSFFSFQSIFDFHSFNIGVCIVQPHLHPPPTFPSCVFRTLPASRMECFAKIIDCF